MRQAGFIRSKIIGFFKIDNEIIKSDMILFFLIILTYLSDHLMMIEQQPYDNDVYNVSVYQKDDR